MKKVTLLLAVICSLNLWAESQHGVVYVKKDATGSGASWNDALGNIQAAINLAAQNSAARKDVWVAAGIYDITAVISMKDSVNLYGGFAGTETAVEQRAKVSNGKAWEFQNPTILKGNGSRLVQFASVLDIPTVIDGFTITDGNGAGSAANGSGGGVVLYNNGVLQNSIVTNCVSVNVSGFGGGVFINGGGTVRFCLIKGNRQTGHANGGGGIFCNTSSTGFLAYIENSEIVGNYSNIRGAGVGIQGQTTTYVRGNKIYNNVAKDGTGALLQGAGIYMNSLFNEVVNNVIFNNTGSNSVRLQPGIFSNNTVVKNVGGIYLAAADAVKGNVINNIVWGCYTDVAGTTATSLSGVAVSNLAVQNNAVYNPIPEDKGWATSGNIRFSSNLSNGDIEEPAEGTIGSGPKFVKVSTSIGAIDTIGVNGFSAEEYELLFNDLATADWSLNAVSPCVNTGKNLDYLADDITGANRPQGFPFDEAKADIGAYELPYYPVAFDGYDASKGEIYGEDGSIVLTESTVLGFAKGQEAVFYFISANSQMPHKVYITRSTNGGVSYNGEKTDVTSEIDSDNLSWTTKVTFPFKISVEWTESSSLDNVAAAQIRCTGANKTITVTGAAQGESIRIYQAGGALIHQTNATGNSISIAVPDGFYIVRAGKIARKIVVR